MRKRRVISKSKTYGFNPWMDQIDTINQIMKETGETTESVVLRKLVDEALAARRKKSQSLPLIEESDNDFDGRLQRIESLLMRLVHQGDTSLRIQDVCLVLQQDVLAEARATHKLSWEFVAVPRLRDEGIDENELQQRFKLQADQAKDYAYGLAQRIKQSQESAK
jgi:hypothetical protein